jgi:hypothetical protein
MKSMKRLNRMILVVLSFTLFLLTGCGGSDSTAFTANQVSGKTFTFANSAGSTDSGTLALKPDNTWNATIGTFGFGGTWNITNGKLVCVTTTNGNFILTYTLLSSTTSVLTTSVVQISPATPGNPTNYTSTLTDVSILPSDLVGTWSDIKKNSSINPALVKINPSSTGKYSSLILNADGTGSIVQYVETLNVTTGEYEIKSDVVESTTSLKWTLASNTMQLVDISGTFSGWSLTKNADGTITEVGTDGSIYMIQKN